jgi:ribosome-associated translation inhibitor RaiA
MQKQIRIVFEGLEHDPAVEARCRAEAEKLERYYDRITGCTVSVSRPHRRHRTGGLYTVGVRLSVPGRELVANRAPPEHHQDQNLSIAIREAFDRARRQLEDYARGQRGDVKQHQPPG